MDYSRELFEAVLEEDFYNTNVILERISCEDDSFNYVDKILEFMENHPNVDYGMPGPLVHFVEKFYNSEYIELLYNSISRKPTEHTLWMANRVLNSKEFTERARFMEILRKVANDENEEDTIRNCATHFLAYQNKVEKM